MKGDRRKVGNSSCWCLACCFIGNPVVAPSPERCWSNVSRGSRPVVGIDPHLRFERRGSFEDCTTSFEKTRTGWISQTRRACRPICSSGWTLVGQGSVGERWIDIRNTRDVAFVAGQTSWTTWSIVCRHSRPCPNVEFQLDTDSATYDRQIGDSGCPSGITMEHFRVLLDSSRNIQSLFVVSELFVKGAVANSIRDIVRIGRRTALQKLSGGVRGIVVEDVPRRVVSRTIAQQLSETVEAATASFQFALITKAGCECVVHAVQVLTEQHPGVEAFDLAFFFVAGWSRRGTYHPPRRGRD